MFSIVKILLATSFLLSACSSRPLPLTLSPLSSAPPPSSVSPPPLLSELNHGSRDLPYLALTFDADMSPYMLTELKKGQVKTWYNQEIIDYLRQENIPATIFISGLWAEKYPEITKSLAQDPLFEIGNHSYSHPRFTSSCSALPPIPSWGKEAEIEKAQEVLEKITGNRPTLFRFPGGCHSPADIKLVNQHRLTVVGWDVVSGDSFNPNQKNIINTVLSRTQNGSILLFHLNGNRNAPETATVLRQVIPVLKKRGFTFIKLSDFLSLAKPEQ